MGFLVVHITGPNLNLQLGKRLKFLEQNGTRYTHVTRLYDAGIVFTGAYTFTTFLWEIKRDIIILNVCTGSSITVQLVVAPFRIRAHFLNKIKYLVVSIIIRKKLLLYCIPTAVDVTRSICWNMLVVQS